MYKLYEVSIIATKKNGNQYLKGTYIDAAERSEDLEIKYNFGIDSVEVRLLIVKGFEIEIFKIPDVIPMKKTLIKKEHSQVSRWGE